MTSESGVRWLSYDELAEARGIDRASAIRMVRRKRWPKQDSNDGTARVAVPASVTGRPVTSRELTGDKAQTLTDDKDQTIKALEGEAVALREALARERERADRAEAAAGVVPELRERTGQAEGEAEGLRAALRTAEAQAATLQANVVREHAVAQTLILAEAAERQAAEIARAELAAWTAGGPITRALRAFWRRG